MYEENAWSGVLGDPSSNVGLVRKVSLEEVEISKKYEKGKSKGPDGILTEVLKVLNANRWKWLNLFLDMMLHEETIPDIRQSVQ